jgi:hypothetical protein
LPRALRIFSAELPSRLTSQCETVTKVR